MRERLSWALQAVEVLRLQQQLAVEPLFLITAAFVELANQ